MVIVAVSRQRLEEHLHILEKFIEYIRRVFAFFVIDIRCILCEPLQAIFFNLFIEGRVYETQWCSPVVHVVPSNGSLCFKVDYILHAVVVDILNDFLSTFFCHDFDVLLVVVT